MAKNIKDERLLKSMAMKDTIVELLKKEPMSYFDIATTLNIDKGQLTNHMVQLKKHGFVDYHPDDKPSFKMTRRYVAIEGMGSYYDLIMQKRSKLADDNYHHKKQTNPHASIVVSCDAYHTRGNKIKTSAWFGYQANGGM